MSHTKKELLNLKHLNHFSLFNEIQGFTLLFRNVHWCLVNDQCYCPFCCTGAIVRDIKRAQQGMIKMSTRFFLLFILKCFFVFFSVGIIPRPIIFVFFPLQLCPLVDYVTKTQLGCDK